ncbi:MAG: hypothetical protein ACRDYY_13170, partial [Acidimicrobiales bacterium]
GSWWRFAPGRSPTSNVNIVLVKQFPVLAPSTYDRPAAWDPTVTVGEWLRPRILELSYAATDLAGFAADLGYHGPPFGWDKDRRR